MPTVTVQQKTRTAGASGYQHTWADVAGLTAVDAWIEDVKGVLDRDLMSRIDERVTHIVHLPVVGTDLNPNDHRIIGVTPAQVTDLIFHIVGTAAEVIRGLGWEGWAATHREYYCRVEPGEKET